MAASALQKLVICGLIFRFDLLKNGLLHKYELLHYESTYSIFLHDIIHSELKIGLKSGIGEEMS